MKAVVLAAGRGRRLGLLTHTLPKALVPVGGEPLIGHLLDLCRLLPLEEILVVGGYEYDRLAAALDRRPEIKDSCRIRLLRNREYKRGNLLTLAAALPHLNGDFFIANVDHLFPKRLVALFLQRSTGITAACDFDRPLGMDDMKIRSSASGRLSAISKKLKTWDGGYIGLTSCLEPCRRTYERAVEATFQRKGKEAVAEEVLETLILWGEAPGIGDCSGHRWWEIDTPAELQRAEKEAFGRKRNSDHPAITQKEVRILRTSCSETPIAGESPSK